ncbi:hypothetical protein [Kitasatospora sp. NBC_01539]|uniref:hypothetical protein n=1 Tax=Kitasatospora sp. NBC_01539 TaxID=2903577 RepID=UPI003860096E
MSATEHPTGPDSHYLTATAQAYGWSVRWRADNTLVMAHGARNAEASFTPEGGFLCARISAPGGKEADPSFRALLGHLEHHGRGLDAPSADTPD